MTGVCRVLSSTVNLLELRHYYCDEDNGSFTGISTRLLDTLAWTEELFLRNDCVVQKHIQPGVYARLNYERLEAVLDEKDVIPDAYILEVSSPGIDRVLRKPRDLVREQGKAVDVTLYAPLDGKKNLTGVLTAFDGEKITLDDELTIELSKAAQIRLHIDF
jgi:hypothetical protein